MDIDALPHLIAAMQHSMSVDLTIPTAIGFDANVFLTLATYPKGAEVIDYLAVQHTGSLILPGQVIQEFWNNQLAAVDTLYGAVKKKLEPLKAEVAKIEKTELSYIAEIEDLLAKFGSEYQALYGAETRRSVSEWLGVLRDRAMVPFVSRRRFAGIAVERDQTKTPPGFKDGGNGDFYVWADFLFGLGVSRANGETFSRGVLVTGDRKIDWVRDGVAHPILTAEADAFLGVPFEIWTTRQLVDAVAKTQL
jgi:hypothetical protein